MKKAIRLVFKVVTLPVAIPFAIFIILGCLFFQFWDWMNDDEFYDITKKLVREEIRDTLKWFTTI